ncbi:MAG: carboxypeptidase regulatory-like domain-containing protein [Acidobacteriota bacterium]
MRAVKVVWIVALMVAASAVPGVAQETGDITGRIVDNSGGVLPGVTVTLRGPAAQLTAVSSETGRFVFPRLQVGVYSLTFELAGFQTVVREGVRVSINATLDISQVLQISTVQETVTVRGQTPVVDATETGTQATFNRELLQSLPTARDPWVILEQTPGIAMDRTNVGGSQSGQQSGYISRGASTGNNKWTIDGVDITDMSATGASPIYYDFDMLEEMQVVTGGADASQQTGGVGINMVTRSGGDVFRGSGRYYVTHERFQADNVTDEMKRQRAGSGAPIKHIYDYGVEAGGPIVRQKLWYWGSYGKQDIAAGIVGFYNADASCQAIRSQLQADPLAPIPTKDVRACLGSDGTLLDNYNWKLSWAVSRANKFSLQNTWAAKTKNARNASDTRPIETTWRQGAVPGSYGTWGWDVGPSPLWKAGDQHIFNDRLLLDVQWAHLGNNFILDFHEDRLNAVQRKLEVPTGTYAASFSRNGPFIRPTTSLDATLNYFLPASLGGDHSLKVGFRYRSAKEHAENHVGGNTEARFNSPAGQSFTVSEAADLWRDSVTNYELKTLAAYFQDTFTRDRMTLKAGLRWDRQSNRALESSVPAHPFAPQWLPAVTFSGADGGVVWNDWSPRLGLTYDLGGDGRTVASASWAIYFGQRSPSQAVSPLNPVTAASIRFPWNDANRDGIVQAGELDYSRILTFSGNYNPDNPSQLTTTGTVDPNVKNDRTREFIVGVDHELLPGLGVGASYIYRKYDRFAWNDTLNFGSQDYVERSFTPSAASCPQAGARCSTVTYLEPTVAIPAAYVYTNREGYNRAFNGLEVTVRKRYANRWMFNASLAYNNAVDHYDSPAGYDGGNVDQSRSPDKVDPTTVRSWTNAQYAIEAGGSGIDNVFINAKWMAKVSGMYTLPWDVNLGAFYNARQGYLMPQYILSPSRANRAGTVRIYLDSFGDSRLPSLQTLDLKVDRSFRLGRLTLIPSLDVFNALNANTILARRLQQNSSTANNISGIVAPRILRFGVRATW